MIRRIASAALILLLISVVGWSGLLRPFQDQLVALRMEVQPRPPTGKIVLVDIDAKSIEAIGRWPWPRRVHAELIDRLVALDAAEIALDIDFSTKSNPNDDAALEAALERAGGAVIIAALAQRETAAADASMIYNRPLDRFARHSWAASTNVRQDLDGRVRRYPYGLIVDGRVVPSIPAMLGRGFGKSGSDFRVDFSIDAGAIDRISVADVLRGDADGGRIAGKKIIVGAQAAELRDFSNVPVFGMISGALLEAVAAETLLQGRALHESSDVVTFIGLIVIVLAAFAIGRISWPIMLGAIALAALIVEAAAVSLQATSTIVVVTAQWHMAFFTLAVIVLINELDLRQIVQLIWRIRARKAEAILSQVVTDNFAGVVVIDETGRVCAASQSAGEIIGVDGVLEGELAADILPSAFTVRVKEAFAGSPGSLHERDVGEILFRREHGEERILEYVVTLSQVSDAPSDKRADPKAGWIACLTFTDATDRRAAEARIGRMARFDALTDLPNRNQLIERLELALVQTRDNGVPTAVVSFDLDNFKNVNDTLGHHIGDLLLQGVSMRASELLSPDGFAARLGGDEFAAVIVSHDAARLAAEYAQRLIARLGEPFDIEQKRIIVGASAGVALADPDDKGPDDALRRADVALYRAKADGRNAFVVFDASMLAEIEARQLLELELGLALDRNQFELWYQPQVDLCDGSLIGVEALVRWRHPERGLISPAAFIKVAEAIGLIEELGEWVLETACIEAAGWPVPVKLAVNVSSVQFGRCDMVGVVERALKLSGLEPFRLELEITESLFMQPSESVHAIFAQLRTIGVDIALDDFGTGFSSLSYIQKFPIDRIKIDQSFVSGLPADLDSSEIVRAVAGLAHNLDIRLIAEGIETTEQESFLRLLGITEGQGYLYGRPQLPADIVRMMLPRVSPSQSGREREPYLKRA